MATKAELETELKALRQQLAERTATPEDSDAAAAETEGSADEADVIDWEKELSGVLAEVDAFSHKQPLLLALGAFTLGLIIGRSR